MPAPEHFEPLPPERAALWANFTRRDDPHFAHVVGIELEEVRIDYCRMRLPYRPELRQKAGMVHGGAIATLLDTVVVPAVMSAYATDIWAVTLDLHIRYLGAVKGEDIVATSWIDQRGKSVVFARAEAATDGSRTVASATATYRISTPRK